MNTPNIVSQKLAVDLYNRIAWTHKIQEEQSDIYYSRGRALQWVSIALLALSSSGIFWSVFNESIELRIASGVMAVASLFISIAREMRSYEVLACEHASYAKDYLSLRTQCEEIVSKANGRIRPEDFDCIRCKYAQLVAHEPRTTDRAVRRAEKAKEQNEFLLMDYSVLEELED